MTSRVSKAFKWKTRWQHSVDLDVSVSRPLCWSLLVAWLWPQSGLDRLGTVDGDHCKRSHHCNYTIITEKNQLLSFLALSVTPRVTPCLLICSLLFMCVCVLWLTHHCCQIRPIRIQFCFFPYWPPHTVWPKMRQRPPVAGARP